MTRGPGWLQGIARATPFRYIIDAIRGAFAGHYLTTIMLEGVLVAVGLAPRACGSPAARSSARTPDPRAPGRPAGRSVCQHD